MHDLIEFPTELFDETPAGSEDEAWFYINIFIRWLKIKINCLVRKFKSTLCEKYKKFQFTFSKIIR